MLSLNGYEKVTCDKCGTQTTKLNLACDKKSCSACTLNCSQCLNFFTISQNDLNYHIAKKHNAPKPDITFKFVIKSFLAFMLYVNTKTFNMDHKWDSERAILMWRT